jgi:hypothetical protein
MSTATTSASTPGAAGRAMPNCLELWGLGALLLVWPIALVVWAVGYGSADRSRPGQVITAVILVAGGSLLLRAAATSEMFRHPRGRVADVGEKDRLETWASRAWLVPLLTFGFGTPIAFFVGAKMARRRWLLLLGTASADLLLLAFVIWGSDHPGSTADAATTSAMDILWLPSALVILAVWLVTRRRRRRSDAVAAVVPSTGPQGWGDYVAGASAPRDAWGYKPPMAPGATAESADDQPVDRLDNGTQ